jgi:hypothetical protein
VRAELPYRFFCALLLLFPARFHTRFGGEMAQVFRDCYAVMAPKAAPADATRFWFRTLTDITFSLLREWHREVMARDRDVDYPGLADSVMLAIVVGMNLVGLCSMGIGFIVAVLPAISSQLLAILTFTLSIGICGVGVLAVTRHRRMESLRIRW